jgi:hypothetical protein
VHLLTGRLEDWASEGDRLMLNVIQVEVGLGWGKELLLITLHWISIHRLDRLWRPMLRVETTLIEHFIVRTEWLSELIRGKGWPHEA